MTTTNRTPRGGCTRATGGRSEPRPELDPAAFRQMEYRRGFYVVTRDEFDTIMAIRRDLALDLPLKVEQMRFLNEIEEKLKSDTRSH
jgi:hypothetical protein